MPQLKRVTGGHVELLDTVGPTILDEAFTCPEPLASRLLADGTGRFVKEE